MALTVNGEFVGDDVLQAEAAILEAQLRIAMPDEDHADRVREWARDNVIERVLLAQAGVDLGLVGEIVHAAHVVKNVDEQTSESQARAAIEAARLALAKRTFESVADEWS